MTIARSIPNGYTEIELTEAERAGNMVIATGSSGGKFFAVGYKGRSAKRAFHYVFSNAEQMERHIQEFRHSFGLELAAKEKAKADKQEQREKGHGIQVGDVFSCSWGYEQTNVDFYQVTRLVGKCSVAVRPIGEERQYTGDMQGVCVPCIDSFQGDEQVKRVNNDGFRVNSYSWASRMKCTEVAGTRVFESRRFSEYA